MSSAAVQVRRLTIPSPAVFDAELARILSEAGESAVFLLMTGASDPATGQSCEDNALKLSGVVVRTGGHWGVSMAWGFCIVCNAVFLWYLLSSWWLA
jgi:acetoin utilization deacetylase AcuC-like enzyme